MEFTSLTAAGKLIMILLCLCGMPKSKETMRIDVIGDKGVIQTVVAKPTAEGFTIFQADRGSSDKLMEIRRDGSPTSFVVSDGDQKINLKEAFPTADFKNISTVSKMELKAEDIGTFNLIRSGGTFYVTGPTGVTVSIHK